MTPIGYQDGIAGLVSFLRKLSPLTKYRPPEERPASLAQWSWIEKLERTLRILKDDHDAAVVPAPPVPPPVPPPPPVGRLAPQTYNKGSSGQDARYCTTGLPRNESGELYEPINPSIRYDDSGLCRFGRTGNTVAGLKPADEMDGREPCDPYTHNDRSFPPWPAGSYDL